MAEVNEQFPFSTRLCLTTLLGIDRYSKLAE